VGARQVTVGVGEHEHGQPVREGDADQAAQAERARPGAHEHQREGADELRDERVRELLAIRSPRSGRDAASSL